MDRAGQMGGLGEVAAARDVAQKKLKKTYLTRIAGNRKTAALFKIQKVWAETI